MCERVSQQLQMEGEEKYFRLTTNVDFVNDKKKIPKVSESLRIHSLKL